MFSKLKYFKTMDYYGFMMWETLFLKYTSRIWLFLKHIIIFLFLFLFNGFYSIFYILYLKSFLAQSKVSLI